MKIEKKLKNEVGYTDKKILEKGKDLKEALMTEYCAQAANTVVAKPAYKRKPVIISICCVIFCLLAAGICLPILLNAGEPIHYLKENETSNATTLETICEAIDIAINEENFIVSSPTSIVDSISEDLLLYSIKIESKIVFPFGSVYFVTNKNYILFAENTNNEHCNWNGFDVSFDILSDVLNDLPVVKITGCLEYDQLRIYFTYTDIDMGEPTTPINFLDSLLII